MLLDLILRNAADDRTTNCTEEAVVGLLACESTGKTTGYSAAKTAFTFLGISGSALLLVAKEKC